jgi:peptide/nickel transport system permease protein
MARMAQYYSGLARGDLGRSVLLNQGVGEAVLSRMPVTLSLTLVALGFACLIGIPAGLVAAAKARGWQDQAAMAAMVGLSLPDFWLGLLLIWLFGVKLGWLPTGGFIAPSESMVGWLRSIAMPAGALALTQLGPIARMTRAAALRGGRQRFHPHGAGQGPLTEPRVYARHVLAASLVPILTVVGIGFGLSLGGALVIEQVFSLPGWGGW